MFMRANFIEANTFAYHGWFILTNADYSAAQATDKFRSMPFNSALPKLVGTLILVRVKLLIDTSDDYVDGYWNQPKKPQNSQLMKWF